MTRAVANAPWYLALATAIAIAGCGGSSSEDQAGYERAAERTCQDIWGDLSPSVRPGSVQAIRTYPAVAEEVLSDGAKRLHDLRKNLGDEATDQIVAFDEGIDPVTDATSKLGDIMGRLPRGLITQADADGVSNQAERTRRAFGALNAKARAAGLDGCGRGGNRVADTVLLAVYRERYTAIVAAYTGTKRRARPTGVQNVRARVARGLGVDTAYLRRLKRLDPPTRLRNLYRREVRLLNRQGHIERRIVSVLANPTAPNLRVAVSLLRRSQHTLKLRIALSKRHNKLLIGDQ